MIIDSIAKSIKGYITNIMVKRHDNMMIVMISFKPEENDRTNQSKLPELAPIIVSGLVDQIQDENISEAILKASPALNSLIIATGEFDRSAKKAEEELKSRSKIKNSGKTEIKTEKATDVVQVKPEDKAFIQPNPDLFNMNTKTDPNKIIEQDLKKAVTERNDEVDLRKKTAEIQKEIDNGKLTLEDVMGEEEKKSEDSAEPLKNEEIIDNDDTEW